MLNIYTLNKWCKHGADRITNRVDSNQTTLKQSDLGLHCLAEVAFPKCDGYVNEHMRRRDIFIYIFTQ